MPALYSVTLPLLTTLLPPYPHITERMEIEPP